MNRDGTHFLPWADAFRVYVRAWTLRCSHDLDPNLSKGSDSVGGQMRGDKDLCTFSGVTSSGRVWRKVPESDARCVTLRLHEPAGEDDWS